MNVSSLARAAVAAVMALFFLVGGTAVAQSQNTWLPNYDRDVKIYVDPALANHPTSPVAFDDSFRQKLSAEAAKHGLDIYVIATQQGADLTGDSKRWAPELLHAPLWNKWTASADFAERDVLIILWVRYKDDPAKNSIAARAGSRLHSYGVTRQRFFDPQGPVISAIRAHIPGDQQGALLAIAENVNADVDRYLAAHAPSSATSSSNESSGGTSPLWILAGFVVLVGGIVLVIALIGSSTGSSSSSRYTPNTRSGGNTTASNSSNNGTSNAGSNTGAIIAGGVLGGLAGSALTQEAERRARERKRDTGTGSDSGSTTTTSSCGSTTTSSCSSGSSCGGGGCGGA